MKYILVALLLFAGTGTLLGQSNIKYTYDAAGNRVKRELCLNCRVVADTSQTKPLANLVNGYKVSVYPNPATNVLYVQVDNLPTDLTTSVVVYDLNGRTVAGYQGLKTLNELDFAGQPTGAYILKIYIGNDMVDWKIIKQ